MNELFFSYKLKELKSHSLHNGQKNNIGKKGKSLQYIDHKAPLIVSKFLKAIGKGKEYPAKKKTVERGSNFELKDKNTFCNNCDK